jgi:alkanesulfonate monooxygenase SsuD/methylene tetrahydromethanopterin reductase-like flavin-dependent oxidoreductase (luciferase family)
MNAHIGFKLDARPPEDVIPLARAAEEAGFDELWVCEDLGLAGGVAQAAAALAVTSRLRVGLGIAPAAVRNAAYLAMEFSSLSRASRNRFHAGIGHGMPSWLEQVGQHPDSLMTCLQEVTESVALLMQGDSVTYHGKHVQLEEVKLFHPPLATLPISLGVRGPKGVALAKDLDCGVILAEGSTPEYVAAVRDTLGPKAHITVFVWFNLDPDDRTRGTEQLRTTVRQALKKPYLAAQLGDLYGTASEDEALHRLTVSGDGRTCRQAIDRLAASGADSIVLQPLLGCEEQQIAVAEANLLSGA